MRPEGLYVGHENVWSDWALHISMVNTFAFKNPQYWFSYHPLYAGGQMTYPFLTNFISGMLIRIGMPLPMSLILPSIIFFLALIMGMYFLWFLLLRSKFQAVIATSIFFLSSGPGFLTFLKQFIESPMLNPVSYLVKEFSRLPEYGWNGGNVVTAILLPQRSFLLGMTMGVWAILGLGTALIKDYFGLKQRRTTMVIAGIIAGIMPISHMHSFIVVIMISFFLCLDSFRNWRLILWYIIPAGIISSFLYFTFIHGGIETSSFFSKLIGWVAKDGLWGWIIMWIRIWGVMLPAAIFSFIFVHKRMSSLAIAFFTASFFIFIVGNLFLFQPIQWDNAKLFAWAYFGFSGLVTFLIADLWNKKINSARFFALIILITVIFTGVLELGLLQRVSEHTYQVTSQDDIRLGLKIREETEPLARFLTAPQHNHFVMIWGLRPILLGYTAWALNYGFNYQQRELDMRVMFLGGLETEELLKKYQISYVVIGPTEIYDLNANEDYFSLSFPVTFQNQNYRIYDTRSILY